MTGCTCRYRRVVTLGAYTLETPHEVDCALTVAETWRKTTALYVREHRARPWPLLVLVFAIAFASSCLTLALSAATSAVVRDGPGPTVLSDVAAVRASSAESARHRDREDPSPASETADVMETARPSGITTQVTPSRDEPARILAIIRNAFAEQGLDADKAIAVATCESSLRPSAIGDSGAAVGLWQWHLAPWTQHATRLFKREVGDLRADPVVSSMVTAYVVSRQGWGIWTCGQ